MGYDRMEQEKSPTEMMYGLTRAFYEEKDAEKILGFYDPKAICWYGMTERGEAYHIQSLREKLQTIFEKPLRAERVRHMPQSFMRCGKRGEKRSVAPFSGT